MESMEKELITGLYFWIEILLPVSEWSYQLKNTILRRFSYQFAVI